MKDLYPFPPPPTVVKNRSAFIIESTKSSIFFGADELGTFDQILDHWFFRSRGKYPAMELPGKNQATSSQPMNPPTWPKPPTIVEIPKNTNDIEKPNYRFIPSAGVSLDRPGIGSGHIKEQSP